MLEKLEAKDWVIVVATVAGPILAVQALTQQSEI